MRLLKKVEVNYLRSLYSATLDQLGDLNVVFGRNDSGKSNLLRALNLFFNETIEPDGGFDFDLDLSDQRRQEARDAKGKQFIWIKITFNVPSNYRTSLGSDITIKRQWNRDGQITETVFPHIDGAGKQARLTRFLNEIDFTYIPAIKDLEVYADLIERMYGAAAETAALSAATTQFVDAIEEQTRSLSEQLTQLFGSPARLAPPTEMSQLFRSLDFAHGADGHSLLRQKGDGIKARHLPELLRFINQSEQRKRFHIWGFEEPENSLDLGAAKAEAKRFAEFSGRADTQIFITSHSPAFYLAEGGHPAEVKRFFITKQTANETGEMDPKNAASMINDLERAESKMEQAGLLQLPFVIRHLDAQRRAIAEKQGEADALRSELARLRRPTLFVEGAHDVTIYANSLRRVQPDADIDIKPLGGTPHSSEALLSAVLQKGAVTAARSAFFLFDNDKAGRGAYRKLCSSPPKEIPVCYHDGTSAWVIPPTPEFLAFAHRIGLSADQIFFTSEFLFQPAEEAAALCAELVSSLEQTVQAEWNEVIHGDYWPSIGQRRCRGLMAAPVGSVDWFFARGVPDRLKRRFHEGAERQGLSLTSLDAVTATAHRSFSEDGHRPRDAPVGADLAA